MTLYFFCFFFSSRRRHTRFKCDWSSDVCSSDLGVLKNAIDCASRPYGDSAWNGKPVAIMSAAMGTAGGLRAQYQLRQCFVFLNMDAVVQPEVAIAAAHQRFDDKGNLTDETSKKMIAQLLQNLLIKARLLRQSMKAAA